MRQKALNRKVLRRADAGVDSITVNGLPPGGISGPIAIVSPMATFEAPNRIHIDNGNEIGFASDATPAPDTDLNNSFVYTLGGAAPFVIPAPLVPPDSAHAAGRKITFTIVYTNGTKATTFAGGADGYQFAPGGIGPTLLDFTTLLAALPGGTSIIKLGFEYANGFNAGATPPWVCVALAGYWV